VPGWLKGALLLGVSFAAGVLLGAGYERHHGARHETMGMDPHHVLEHFAKELHLDSAQIDQVRSILVRRQATVDSAWHSMQPHISATLDSTLREVLVVLRPDQAEKYRRMIGEMHPGALH
jgi:hypothetical protein